MKTRQATVTETTWRDIDRTPYRMLVINYEDGSGYSVKIPFDRPLIPVGEATQEQKT